MASAPAASGSAAERVQRTERRLIDAALAVNDAASLEDALAVLARAGCELIGADRVSVARIDRGDAAVVTVAQAGIGDLIGRRLPLTAAGLAAIDAGEPFPIDRSHLELPGGVASALAEVRSRLCVPLPLELVFFASWLAEIDAQELELVGTKLRLLGRLTGIAVRSERERVHARDEAQLRAVLDAVPDGLVVRTGSTAIVNAAARDLLASDDPPERIGLRTLDGSEVDPAATPLMRAILTGEPQTYRLWVTRYDGLERVHEGSIAPVKDADGDVFATVTLFRDVTEEHERRFVTEQFLASLFDALPTAVGVSKPESGEVVSVNRAFLDLVGYELDEVLGATRPYPWWADETAAVETVGTSTQERLFRRKDGTLVPVEITRTVVPSASGEAANYVAVITDLSERRAFEQQLIQSGKLASIGELAAGVAHEVNNPLFAILGFVEFLLADAEEGTKAHERLTLIQSTALEIKDIVRALLDFARERSDARSLVSLTDVAAQTVELMRRTSSAKQVVLVERFGPEPVPVVGSANQLKQIFVNLISNATQAMKGSGGTITVEVGRDGSVAWAEVRDDGPGIQEDVLAKVFEPFFTTRRDVGGTGLGLSVSFGIAQAHGGSLTVESVVGEGTSFRLRLPLADERELAA